MKIEPYFKGKAALLFAHQIWANNQIYHALGAKRAKNKQVKRAACIAHLPANHEMEPGTPERWVSPTGVVVLAPRGAVNHFHRGPSGVLEPTGWDPGGFVLACGKSIGISRKALREFLALYKHEDKQVRAHRLRSFVRSGD